MGMLSVESQRVIKKLWDELLDARKDGASSEKLLALLKQNIPIA